MIRSVCASQITSLRIRSERAKVSLSSTPAASDSISDFRTRAPQILSLYVSTSRISSSGLSSGSEDIMTKTADGRRCVARPMYTVWSVWIYGRRGRSGVAVVRKCNGNSMFVSLMCCKCVHLCIAFMSRDVASETIYIQMSVLCNALYGRRYALQWRNGEVDQALSK